GRGRAYLLGFCLQDTLFQAWETAQHGAVREINGLLDAITVDAGVRPHIHASNGDSDATLRANDSGGFVFVIAHEPQSAKTGIIVLDIPWPVAKVIDVETDQEIPVTRAGNAFEINFNMPIGTTRILRLLPAR